MALPPIALPNVTILGDSRVFDTYYLTSAYGESRYGYDRTFPHLLRGALLRRATPPADVVHIPDHFRGASVDNNILRLALTDPTMVVLLEGIWETLLTKQHFIDYVTRKVRLHPWRRGGSLALEFSTAKLAELFMADELSVGPGAYRDRQERLVSYFRRRRRQVVWMTLPIPPRDHLGGVHLAGNYKPLPEWGDCLAALNAALVPMVEEWGGAVVDLNELMAAEGGAAGCLIDQWHFSPAFHAAIAARLEGLIGGGLDALPGDHVSRRCIVPGPVGELPLVLCGAPEARRDWRAANADARVAAEIGPDGIGPGGAPPAPGAAIVLIDDPGPAREATARRLLAQAPADAVVLYPEELLPIDNPATADQAQHGVLR